ncbi:hypothetical protein WJX77_006828 [Trebouxia sp. C0004]
MTQGNDSHNADQLVQECVGFEATSGHSRWCGLLLPFAAALAAVLARMAPQLAAKLLAPCNLQQADYVLVKLIDGRHRLLGVKTHSPRADLSVFSKTVDRSFNMGEGQTLRTFKLFWRLYTYSPEHGTFQPVPAMPPHLPKQICRAVEGLHLINTAGVEWRMLNAAQKQARRDMVPLYGTKRPLLKGLVGQNAAEHSFGPIFTVQMLEVGYLIYRGRYFYPVLVLSLFLVSAGLLIHTLRCQRKKIMALVNECRLTPLVWDGWVRAMSSHRLLPGDVMVLQPGKALCDMVLLQGTCLVMESMLSGEATQVRKSNYVREKGVDYDPEKHRTCTVYAGTLVQQVWNAQDAQDEVLVMVVRTGLNTTMGSMVRELITPVKGETEPNPFLADVFHLYAFALCLQILIHIPYFIKAATFRHTTLDVVQKILDTCCYAAPIGVPTIMLMAGQIGHHRLARHKIALMFAESLKLGALADVVCFDKTGTLTHSATQLAGVLPVHKREFQAIQQSALRWSNRLKQAVAVCNSLTMVNRNTVVGEDMERRMFKAVEARFLDREHVVLPRQPDHTSDALLAKLSIAKVMDFTSQTLRSGVVVWSDDGPKDSALLFLRGAPAVIRDMVQPNTVPQDFNQVMDDYSSKSFRLLAMAMGVIPNAASLDFTMMTQQQVEACAVHMQLLSLVVLTNNVRSDSKDTITHLQDGGGLRTVMITGDYHHTAVAVARQVEMVKPDGQVVVIDATPKEMPHQDQSTAQTPDVGNSAVNSPWCTPQVSFRQRNADFAHAFAAQPAQAQKGVDASVAHLLSRASIEAAKVSRLSCEAAGPTRVSEGLPPSRMSLEGQKPSRMSIEGKDRRDLPFKAPATRLPAGAVFANWVTSEAGAALPFPKVELSLDNLPLARTNAVHGKAPFEAAYQTSLSKRQPIKASSLIRLPRTRRDQVMDPSEAFTSMTEGCVQCAVTGDAFEHLLQMRDVSLLEAVMRNAVVFSRMQPHQKGQVMDLLGTRGIHHQFQGQPRHIQGLGNTTIFCGDGINDLAALSAADVGMSIGATDAFIAAAISTPKGSVSGLCIFIRNGKSSHAMMVSLFKYMVVYECILSLLNCVAFFVDGSSLSNLQSGAIDAQAMVMALAMCLVPPLAKLNRHKPSERMCTLPVLALLAVMALALAILDTVYMALLISRPWFVGGTGNSNMNPVVTLAWLFGYYQLLAPLISLTVDTKSFCQSPLRFKPVLIICLVFTFCLYVTVLVRTEQFVNPLNFYNFSQTFRLQFAGLTLAGVTFYASFIHAFRLVMNRYGQRRLSPL